VLTDALDGATAPLSGQPSVDDSVNHPAEREQTQGGAHAEPLEESLGEEQPAEVRRLGGREDNAEPPRSSGHFRETSLVMRLNGDQHPWRTLAN